MLGVECNGEINIRQGRGGECRCRDYNFKQRGQGVCAKLWEALLRSHFRMEEHVSPALEKNYFIQGYDSLGRPTSND